MNESDLMKFKAKARQFRLDVLEMTSLRGGHLSSCFSSVEILTAVYFGGILRYLPQEPDWPARDRFIVSKGHIAPLMYAVLAEAGFFPRNELARFRQIGSPLHGHPIQGSLPGVEITSGSLGQGLSFGLGHALAARHSRLDYRVYVLLGDGECQEGQIWEAAMAAAHFKTDNLIAIVDFNKIQQTGPVSREMGLEPFAAKWGSFGWQVTEVDGHDLAQLIAALQIIRQSSGRPAVLIAHTVKGKGISFVENDPAYHGRSIPAHLQVLAEEQIRVSG